MVVLLVILSIIAIVVILLHFSATAYLKLSADGVDFRLKYLFFTLYPREIKAKKSGKIRKSRRRKPKAQEPDKQDFSDSADDLEQELRDFSADAPANIPEPSDSGAAAVQENPAAKENPQPSKPNKSEKTTSGGKRSGRLAQLRERYQKLKPYLPMGWRYFRKLTKSVRIRVDSAAIKIGREDAHEAAIYYGAVQAAAAGFLSGLSELFTVNVRRLDVDCCFTENVIDANAELSVRLRPSAVIAIAICAAVNFLIIRRKQKSNNKAEGEPQAASV